MLIVFSFMDKLDIAVSSMVSRSWRALADDQWLWRAQLARLIDVDLLVDSWGGGGGGVAGGPGPNQVSYKSLALCAANWRAGRCNATFRSVHKVGRWVGGLVGATPFKVYFVCCLRRSLVPV